LKLIKISLSWVRISLICITVIVIVIMVSHQPGVEKLVKKIMTPSLATSEKEWILELDKTFILCGHSESVRSSYSSLELLQAAIQDSHGYELKKAKGNLQVYVMPVRDYCSNCLNNQFLGINEQNVAVIRGIPEKPGPILEKVAIKIDDLPKLELEDLQKGIPFKNDKEKLQLIEGLKGLSTN
jgi:hypothetical protein